MLHQKKNWYRCFDAPELVFCIYDSFVANILIFNGSHTDILTFHLLHASVYLKTEASELVSQTSRTVPSTDMCILQKRSLLQTGPLISWSVDYSCPNSCHHIIALIFIINGRMIVNFPVITIASEVLVQFCDVCLETWLRHGGWKICYLKPLKQHCTLNSKIPQ